MLETGNVERLVDREKLKVCGGKRGRIMRKKSLHKAKLVIRVIGRKKDRTIKTESVFDNRTGGFWTEEQIDERGITEFLDFEDMKMSLNWNLNGIGSLFQFKWGQSSKEETEGLAYVFG